MTAPSASEHEPVFQPITTQAQLDQVVARELAAIRGEYAELRRKAAQVDRDPAGARGSEGARGSNDAEGPR